LRQSIAVRRGNAEIVIVDNHSPRHPLVGRLRRVEGISLRRFKRNHGFARAVNEGCRLSRGNWFLLLNPDMSVAPGFLDDVERIIARLDADEPRVGVVGLGVRNTDGSPQPSCGPLPTLLSTVSGLFVPRALRRCKALAVEARTEVPWATGCALLVRKECLQQLGGFDEDYFLYYEDVDFCRRAVESGWKVCHEPTVCATHHTPLHTRKVSAPMRFVTRHALLTYGLKHWARLQSALLGGLIWLEAGIRQVGAWWKGRREDAFFHWQTRQMVGHAWAQRQREVRRSIRNAADYLAAGASAQDGQTS
jgi:GT2 family glycosyltransferase